MNINRKIHPQFKNIDSINIPRIEKRILDNNVEAYMLNAGAQDILKIDLVFDIDNRNQENPLIASTVNKMLIEGSKTLNSQQIAEKLDYYGAFIQLTPTKDLGNITLYTLKKYLPKTLEVLDDIIKNPTFPENELSIFLNKEKQKFLIELGKVTELARREFNEQLFGKDHPYGKKIKLEDYGQINHNELARFHKEYYNPCNCKIIISGKINEQDIALLNEYLGDKSWASKQKKEVSLEFSSPVIMESFVEKEDVTQSAIRLGKIIIPRSHPDYHNLDIINTILGGYFGSRLMKAIREKKGYTYGISSFMVTLKNAEYLLILSEVGSNVTKNAITDILLEIRKLRKELVPEDELKLVKNYMLGSLLRSFDGPLEQSSSFKPIIELGLNCDFFSRKFEAIKSITPQKINNLAKIYLNEDSLIKTIAGKYN